MKFLKILISTVLLITILSLVVSRSQKNNFNAPDVKKEEPEGGCCGQQNVIYNSISKQVQAISKSESEFSKKVNEQQSTIKSEFTEMGKLLDEIKLNTKNLNPEPRRKSPADYAVGLSKILRDRNDYMKIKGWLNNSNFKLRLCYSSEIHAKNSGTFHQLCDNRGATLTLVESTAGVKFGGFTRQSWESSGRYKNGDGNDFIFSLTYNFKSPNSVHRQYATYNNVNYFPTFGGGHDIYLASNCFYTNGNYSYFYSYASRGEKVSGSYNFQVSKLEVYLVDFNSKRKLMKKKF